MSSSKCNNDPVQCYFCSKPKTSMEHVPARAFFDTHKKLKENLIKVPACDEHNNHKTKLDELMGLLFLVTRDPSRFSKEMGVKFFKRLKAKKVSFQKIMLGREIYVDHFSEEIKKYWLCPYNAVNSLSER